jgi:hypothetical protein
MVAEHPRMQHQLERIEQEPGYLFLNGIDIYRHVEG